MRGLTIESQGWLRITTAMGVISLLLAPVTTDLFCAPRTEKFGSAIYRKMVWNELPAFLEGEKKVTIVLAEGGAVRGDVAGVPDNGIHLSRVSMTTNGWLYPTGSDALIPRSSVKEIRVEKRGGLNRVGGAVLGYRMGKRADVETTIIMIVD